MINIRILSKDSRILSFEINNHCLINRDAIIAGEAYDMVCNSVSVLSQSVIIGLDEVMNLNINYDIGEGYLSLNLDGLDDNEIEKAQVLLKTFKQSICSVILSLDETLGKIKREEYIKLSTEEV